MHGIGEKHKKFTKLFWTFTCTNKKVDFPSGHLRLTRWFIQSNNIAVRLAILYTFQDSFTHTSFTHQSHICSFKSDFTNCCLLIIKESLDLTPVVSSSPAVAPPAKSRGRQSVGQDNTHGEPASAASALPGDDNITLLCSLMLAYSTGPVFWKHRWE